MTTELAPRPATPPADRAAALHALATQAAHDLTLDWIAATHHAAQLANALAACHTAHPGQRELAKRQAITLHATAQTATALLQRNKSEHRA